jgi:uncharacterized protein (DUF2267 family)
VKQEEMVATVAERAGTSRRHADEIITATLTVLAERLTADETKDLLAQLPKKYKANINAVSVPELLTADDFVKRVAELEGDRAPAFDDAQTHVRAVLTTLREAVNAGEFHDILDQLGADYAPLLEGGPPLPTAVTNPPSAPAARGANDFTTAADVGRESARNLLETVSAVARLAQERANDVASAAKDRALDLVVVAVDRIEAVTDRIDDAAESLQERVHRRVDEERSGNYA